LVHDSVSFDVLATAIMHLRREKARSNEWWIV